MIEPSDDVERVDPFADVVSEVAADVELDAPADVDLEVAAEVESEEKPRSNRGIVIACASVALIALWWFWPSGSEAAQRGFGKSAYVLLGAGGNLASIKLFPDLLAIQRAHGVSFKVIANDGNPSIKDFNEHLVKNEKLKFKSDEEKNSFLKNTHYVGAFLTDILSRDTAKKVKAEKAVEQMKNLLKDVDTAVFHLSIPQNFFAQNAILIHQHFKREGLKIRLVVEKPQGNDGASFDELRTSLLGTKEHPMFKEEELYLMDHYLGKVPVQKIPEVRNHPKLKSRWNKDNIEKITIFMDETVDCHDRGSFYDQCGVVRDVIQNHILQMFALATMDLSVKDPRDAKVKVLQETTVTDSKLAQYKGYASHDGVNKGSKVPTFANVKVSVPSWPKTEFLLRSGKALAERQAGVIVSFKDGTTADIDVHKAKASFKDSDNKTVTLDFPQGPVGAYGSLIMDAIKGDQTNFVRTDEVQAMWKVVAPLLGKPTKVTYPVKSENYHKSLIFS